MRIDINKLKNFIESNRHLAKNECIYYYSEIPHNNINIYKSRKEFINNFYEDNMDFYTDCLNNAEVYAFTKFLDNEKNKYPLYNFDTVYEFCNYLDIENIDEVSDVLHEYVDVDIVSNYLDKTILHVNLFPFQYENLNTEGDQLVDILSYIKEENKKEIIQYQKEKPDCIMTKLFQSQGYNIVDILDREKREKSKFLKTMNNEIHNITDDYNFIVFSASVNLKDFYDFYENEKTIRLKDPFVGLFNPIHGGGSLLDVELEQPFEYQYKKESIDNIQIENSCKHSDIGHYGYTVQDVYGLGNDFWEHCTIEIID